MSRYYTLDEDTYPRFFHDDGEEMDLFAFIHVVDPTKLKIVKREHAEEERKLLDFTVGRVVPLLPVASARAEGDLEASVDRLFDQGGSTNQGDFAAGSGYNVEIKPITNVEDIVAENVTTERPKRQRKKRSTVAGASLSSHPPKKLRGDHKTSSGVATGDKSPYVIKELLARSILNVEANVEAVATLPLITSSVSATPEHEGGDLTDSVTGLNLRTIGPSERFVISSDSSYCSSTNTAEVEVDSFIRYAAPLPVMTEAVITTSIASAPSIPVLKVAPKITPQVQHSIFHDSGSVGTIKPDVAGPSHLPGKELSMGSREIYSETFHEVFVPQWNVPNDTLLDDHDVSWEFVNHLTPLVLFAQIREMNYHHLFTEFIVGTACQACLNAEVRTRTEYCLSERRRLKFESEATEAARLRIQVSAVEAAQKVHVDELNVLKQKSMAFEDERDSLNGKIIELKSSVSAKDL
ncbi:hypothetical protein Tco_0211887 [Tanacetum coccineum]